MDISVAVILQAFVFEQRQNDNEILDQKQDTVLLNILSILYRKKTNICELK
jgi:hypothetical protein